MNDLLRDIALVPDFPRPGILFRDIMPLLRNRFADTIAAMDALLSEEEWRGIDVVAGIESRGFIVGAALALHRGKGFVALRKQGKLPPPLHSISYRLEYGEATLELQPGSGNALIVDDVLATGGSLVAAAELCQQAGYTVRELAVLLDLGLVPGLRWRGLRARCAIHCD